MKNPVLYILLLITVLGCTDSHEPMVKTSSFNIAFQANDISNGRRLSLEGSSSIFMTIEDARKNIILDKEISLIKLNDDYLTESILLNEGNYTLTRFLVLDKDDNAIYATPMQESREGHQVDDALPISFAISPDRPTSLALEVVSLESHTASDIGYLSFQLVERKCTMSATVNDQEALCYENSRAKSHYIIAYASVPGEPSVFSLNTPFVSNGDESLSQINVETTEFTGPGTYTIRKYDGGRERSTYGAFGHLNAGKKQMEFYYSVSGTLVVESVRPIAGTTSGLATGTFTMTAEDEHGNSVNISGRFDNLRGMGWWD